MTFASGPTNSFTGALISMFEILQYLTFLLFLNTELPPACDDFISTLFENTIELGAILNEILIKLNIKNINFAFNYNLDVKINRNNFLDSAEISEGRSQIHASFERSNSFHHSDISYHPLDHLQDILLSPWLRFGQMQKIFREKNSRNGVSLTHLF